MVWNLLGHLGRVCGERDEGGFVVWVCEGNCRRASKLSVVDSERMLIAAQGTLRQWLRDRPRALERRTCCQLGGIMNGGWRWRSRFFQKVLQFQSLVRLAAMLPLLSSRPLPTAFTGVLGARLSPLAAASTRSSFHFPYMPQQCPHPL